MSGPKTGSDSGHQLHAPHPKRRKISPSELRNPLDLHANGILTPLDDCEMHIQPEEPASHLSPPTETPANVATDDMVTDIIYEGTECPCGYLHGPGQQHHDITAVGLSSNMMRGPD